MKIILNIFNTQKIKKNLKEASYRFPISVSIIIVTVILLFIQLHYSSELAELVSQNIAIAIFSLIMTFFFSIGIYLTSENTNFTKIKRNGFQIIAIIFGILFFNVFNGDMDSFENMVFFFLSISGIISYLFFAPYFKNLSKIGIKQSIYYSYFYNISILFFISFILAGLLFALGSIGIATVEALFDLNIDGSKTYGNWAIISLSLLTPLFTLTQIPKEISFNKSSFNENMFFSFLTKYILIPFITMYFLILYAYSIKVLSNFGDWPKGEVSWMVIGFSILGYITYIYSYIFDEKNKFIKTFRTVFPYIVVPQILMLFYAIYLRINQYDITVNRYFVVSFGIWLLVISLYYIFSKKKSLFIIPAVLTLFTIILSIGPWSVYSFPELRQLDRLKMNLLEANILKNNQITPLLKEIDISQDLSKNIYSGIKYLCDFDNCKVIKELFPVIYQEVFNESKLKWKKRKEEDLLNYEKNKLNYKEYNELYKEEIENRVYNGPVKWEIVSEITKKIKVSYYSYGRENNEKYLNFYKKANHSFFPMDISGYSKMYKITGVNNLGVLYDEYAEYNPDNETIKIIGDGGNIEIISTEQLTIDLLKKEITELKIDTRDIEDLSFEIEDNNKKYKLFFERIKIKNPKYVDTDGKNYIPYSYIEGFILVE